MDAPRRDRQLLGEFEIVRTIGSGGMGVVFEVVSRKTGVSYAAKKVLKPGDPAARERFQREAELLARCDRHPGIVKVHSFGEAADGAPYMVLDLVRGEGLEKVLEREGRLPARRAAEVARDVASALAFVHERGVIHRDVKPSNILLEGGVTPRLTDFGLATASDLERLTRTGQFVGTLFYCAPEQSSGQTQLLGPWTDVFALGAVLFHTLAGEPPFGGESPVELMARLHDAAPAPDVRTLAPEVPEALAAIVARALEKKPERRYPSGAELALDLDCFLTAKPVAAANAARRSRTGLALRRLAAASLAVISLTAAGLGARVVLRAREADRALDETSAAIESARHLLAAPGHTEKDTATAIRADLERGRDRLRAALALGAADTGARAAALDALTLELATVEAGRELARGAPARALEILDGAKGPLGPTGRLARARALAALGRGAEALREIAALPPTLPADLRAEAAEVRGDVFANTGDFRNAALEYGRALDAGSRTEREVRAKRGGAAALSGDAATALACVRALLPDQVLATLSDERSANEKLAPLAPALYLQATTATTPKEKLRLLEAASRLADEPEALRKVIAQAWYDVALDESDVLVGLLMAPRWSAGGATGVRRTFQHFGRALKLDPGINAGRFWGALGTLTVWAHNVGTADPEGLKALLFQLRDALPDQPTILLLCSQRLNWDLAGERARALALLRHALDKLPPPEPDEDPALTQVASELVVSYVRAATLYEPDVAALGADIELVRAAAAHGDTSDSWMGLAHAYLGLRDVTHAREAIDRGATRPRMQGQPASDEPLIDARISLLLAEGKTEEVDAFAQRTYDEHPSDEMRAYELARTLNALHRPERVLELFPDVKRLGKAELVREVGRAAVQLGLEARFKEASARLDVVGTLTEAAALRAFWAGRR